MGAFQRVEALWQETGLVFHWQDAVWSLDGGAVRAREVYDYGRRSGSSGESSTWSADGCTWYGWLDLDDQLVAMDANTGERRTLLKLPTQVWNYEARRHMDPRPVPRVRGGVVEDVEGDRLLVLVAEQTNEQVSPADGVRPCTERRLRAA